jgi:DNA modification methylase
MRGGRVRTTVVSEGIKMSKPFEIHNTDCRDAMKMMESNSIDSIVTDPPYGLSFMGKGWDHGVPGVEFWVEALRVAKPGAHLLAFGGTRTFHRLAVAIEDAGWEIRDTVMWVYGSGFPKSHDVNKAIGKAAGAEREVVGRGKKQGGASNGRNSPSVGYACESNEFNITAPATDAARQWSGWGTALKPAWEPVIVARKPLVSPCINVLDMVECQLRDRGVTGGILWKPENASGAPKSKKTKSSGSTKLSEPSATSAKNAAENETQKTGPQTPKSSEVHGISGAKQTPEGKGNSRDSMTGDCANVFSQPTAESVSAAANPNPLSSQSTTSTAGERSTESKSTEKSMPNCGATDSRPDTEFFVGIATGLTGSMATVRINRDSDGMFIWPMNLPKSIPGKPLTVAENVLRYGTGAINVDGCRVGTERLPAITAGQAQIGTFERGAMVTPEREGRWPANVIHDGSDEVMGLFPVTHAPGSNGSKGTKGKGYVGDFGLRAVPQLPSYTDSGSAARFFYCAKASKADRDEGCEELGERTAGECTDRKNGSAGMNSPREGAGRTSGSRNHHPTVKPTALMRYLCRLVTPPNGLILDPFMGSGSTGKAAILEGYRFIGIDLEPEYCKIAEARIAHVTPQMKSST